MNRFEVAVHPGHRSPSAKVDLAVDMSASGHNGLPATLQQQQPACIDHHPTHCNCNGNPLPELQASYSCIGQNGTEQLGLEGDRTRPFIFSSGSRRLSGGGARKDTGREALHSDLCRKQGEWSAIIFLFCIYIEILSIENISHVFLDSLQHPCKAGQCDTPTLWVGGGKQRVPNAI